MDVYRFIRNWAVRIFYCSYHGHVQASDRGQWDNLDRCYNCRMRIR